jgi:hypothetical protein
MEDVRLIEEKGSYSLAGRREVPKELPEEGYYKISQRRRRRRQSADTAR